MFRHPILAVTAGAALLVVAAPALATPAPTVTRSRLSNGIEAVVVQNKTLQRASISRIYKWGSRTPGLHEARKAEQLMRAFLAAPIPGIAGPSARRMARLSGLEAAFFNTKSKARRFWVEFDRSSLSLTVPVFALPLALKWEGLRAANTAGLAHSGPVAEAKAQALLENRGPMDQFVWAPPRSDLKWAADYSQPKREPLGSQELVKLGQRFSGANALIVGVSSPLPASAVMPMLEKAYGGLRPGSFKEYTPAPLQPLKSRRRINLSCARGTEGYIFQWNSPAYLHRDDVLLGLTSEILRERLKKRIPQRPKNQFNRWVGQRSRSNGSSYQIYMPKGKMPGESAKIVAALLAELAAKPPSPTEFQRAKETIVTHGQEAVYALTAEASIGRRLWRDAKGTQLQETYANLASARPQDVSRVVITYLHRKPHDEFRVRRSMLVGSGCLGVIR